MYKCLRKTKNSVVAVSYAHLDVYKRQIYLLMMVLETVILLLCGMPIFDALTTAFGTAGTGGFGIKNDSMGGYSVTIQIVVTVFMILFGINFNVYFLLLSKKWKQALKNEEVRCCLLYTSG